MPCTTILVGKKASHDNSTIIARNDDGGFEAKRLLTHPAREKASTYKTVISHLTVELPGNAMRYTDCPNVTKTNGVWPACGINEANVAMTATETITSNARVIGADPYVRYQKKKNRNAKEVPGGIGEEDLVTLVLPYIHSAREGVLRTGALLEQYGTYEPNGMAFADAKEIWWLETIGGHHWIARRVPDDRWSSCPTSLVWIILTLRTLTGSRRNTFAPRTCRSSWKSTTWPWIRGRISTPDWPLVLIPTLTIFTIRPRAWFMARYFLPPHLQVGSGDNADFTPESNDIPWSFVPERKGDGGGCAVSAGGPITRGQPTIPTTRTPRARGNTVPSACPTAMFAGSCRFAAICQRQFRVWNGCPWAGSGFTACFPVIRQCDGVPQVPQWVPRETVFHGQYVLAQPAYCRADGTPISGMLCCLTSRYVNAVMNRGQQFLYEYDEKIQQGEPVEILKEANSKIAAHGEGRVGQSPFPDSQKRL